MPAFKHLTRQSYRAVIGLCPPCRPGWHPIVRRQPTARSHDGARHTV